jgi:hypothetical protein
LPNPRCATQSCIACGIFATVGKSFASVILSGGFSARMSPSYNRE